MSKTLYITDLDGTFLDSRSKVSAKTASLVNKAVSKGALFSIATARTPATISVLMRDVDMRIPAVVMTGVALWDRGSDRYTDVHHFDAETVERVLRIYEECHLPAFLYTLRDHKIVIYHRGSLSATERKFIEDRIHSPFKRFEIPPSGESIIPERVDNGLLFFAMQPTESARRAYDRLRDVKGVNPIFYYDPTYGEGLSMSEAFPAAASKANAARLLAKRIGADRIVAFGDNLNDLPLLRIADVSVAVENAIPEVKREADIIIGNHDDDAVARFIYEDFD